MNQTAYYDVFKKIVEQFPNIRNAQDLMYHIDYYLFIYNYIFF